MSVVFLPDDFVMQGIHDNDIEQALYPALQKAITSPVLKNPHEHKETGNHEAEANVAPHRVIASSATATFHDPGLLQPYSQPTHPRFPHRRPPSPSLAKPITRRNNDESNGFELFIVAYDQLSPAPRQVLCACTTPETRANTTSEGSRRPWQTGRSRSPFINTRRGGG